MSNKELIQAISAGGNRRQLMLELWKQNKKLIYKIAERYKGYMPLDDLMQEGYIALDNAARLFDASMGCAFSTYLVNCLKRRFYRLCAEKGSVIHIPQHMYVKLMDFNRKKEELTARLKRKPIMAELMIYTGLSRKEIKSLDAAAAAVTVKSLDTPIAGDDQDITLADVVADKRDDIGECTEDVSRQQESMAIWAIVDELPDKQGDIIKERYIKNATLEETAKACGISKNRVFTQEMKAMRALKSPAYAKRLLPYYDGVRSRAMHGTGVKRFNETWTSATEREALRLYRYL